MWMCVKNDVGTPLEVWASRCGGKAVETDSPSLKAARVVRHGDELVGGSRGPPLALLPADARGVAEGGDVQGIDLDRDERESHDLGCDLYRDMVRM